MNPEKDKGITEFSGEYRFLSNFWPAAVRLDGVRYPSVEAAYQAAKTVQMELRKAFTHATPGAAKRAGRKLPMRPDWEAVKEDVMRHLLAQKFSYPELREKLLDTRGRTLVEGNTWGDTYWGVCRGTGRNRLGILLMQLRESLS